MSDLLPGTARPRTAAASRRSNSVAMPGPVELLALTSALLVAAAAVGRMAAAGGAAPATAAAFAVLVVVGEVLRVRMPNGREAAPLAVAGALGYAFITNQHGHLQRHGAAQTAAVVAVAVVAGSLVHVVVGRSAELADAARRLLVGALAGAAYRPLAEVLQTERARVVAMMTVAVIALTADAVLGGLVDAERLGGRRGAAVRNRVQAEFGVAAAVGSTGLLVALAARPLGLWALPLLSAPLVVTQLAVRRLATSRATYHQTIRALSRVTEIGGYVEAGHSRRVGDLAVAIGRELGMSEGELLDLEYAALLHDIGQLSFTEPIPAGATLVLAPEERRKVAELGADIVRRTGALDRVAVLVERQADPYRRPGEHDDVTLPMAARVVKAANAFDDLVGAGPAYQRQLDAMEHLRLSMSYEYDPRVVEALTRLVDREALPLG